MTICVLFVKKITKHSLHQFYECRYVSQFWQTLKKLSKEVLFGITDPKKTDEILNFIFLVAKRYIYTCRYNNQNFNIQTFHNTLVFHYNVEKYIQYSSCNWDKFNNRRSPYQTLVNITAPN
jgi:hypothetical protein